MSNFTIPIEPVASNLDTNCLVASVSHSKHHKEVIMYVHSGVSKDGSLSILLDGRQKSVKIEPMPRLNRKRLEAIHEEMVKSCKEKTGVYYGHALAYATERGYKIS